MKFLFTLQRPLFDLILIKHCQTDCLTISRPSFYMGPVSLKTRSPGQIIGNSCLNSRGYICCSILMKRGQKVCFDNIQAKFKYGSCQVKNQVTRSNLRNSFLNIISDLNPQVSPVVYKAMKKGNSKKSSLSGERSRALWALLLSFQIYTQSNIRQYVVSAI